MKSNQNQKLAILDKDEQFALDAMSDFVLSHLDRHLHLDDLIGSESAVFIPMAMARRSDVDLDELLFAMHALKEKGMIASHHGEIGWSAEWFITDIGLNHQMRLRTVIGEFDGLMFIPSLAAPQITMSL